MRRPAVVAVVAGLMALSAIATNPASAEQKAESSDDLAAQIKALQEERGDTLTKLVQDDVARYRVGVVSCETVIGAETDLVNAQLDATDEPEARVALLTECLKRETEFLKATEARYGAGAAGRADVFRANSLLLAAKTRLLQERSGQADVAAQIKTIQEERIQTLGRIIAVYLEEYRLGRIAVEAVLSAQAELDSVQLEATDKHEERVALLTQALKRATEFQKTVENRYKTGRTSQADLEWARSLALETETILLNEQKNTAAQVKALQKERIEMLTKVVASYERLYQTGQSGFEPLFDTQTALANARIDATDQRETRVALLTELVKGATGRLRVTNDKYTAGFVGETDLLQAKSLLLDAKIRLLRERAAQKAPTK